MMEIHINGLDKLVRKLDRLSTEMQRKLKDAIKKAGFTVEAITKPITPIDTGRLRSSISSDIFLGGWEVRIAPHTEYACIFGSRTSVRTKDKYKQISLVKERDYVFCQDGNYHKVLATSCRNATEKPNLIDLVIDWRKDKKHKITLTEDHKVLSETNKTIHWIEARKLKINDIVFCPIANVKKIREHPENHPINPGMNSYVNLEKFERRKVLSVRKWHYKPKSKNHPVKLYDLSVEDVHSFVASGIIISNCFVHEGTSRWPLRMPPKAPGTVRQFMKVGAEKATPQIQSMFQDVIRQVLEQT